MAVVTQPQQGTLIPKARLTKPTPFVTLINYIIHMDYNSTQTNPSGVIELTSTSEKSDRYLMRAKNALSRGKEVRKRNHADNKARLRKRVPSKRVNSKPTARHIMKAHNKEMHDITGNTTPYQRMMNYTTGVLETSDGPIHFVFMSSGNTVLITGHLRTLHHIFSFLRVEIQYTVFNLNYYMIEVSGHDQVLAIKHNLVMHSLSGNIDAQPTTLQHRHQPPQQVCRYMGRSLEEAVAFGLEPSTVCDKFYCYCGTQFITTSTGKQYHPMDSESGLISISDEPEIVLPSSDESTPPTPVLSPIDPVAVAATAPPSRERTPKKRDRRLEHEKQCQKDNTKKAGLLGDKPPPAEPEKKQTPPDEINEEDGPVKTLSGRHLSHQEIEFMITTSFSGDARGAQVQYQTPKLLKDARLTAQTNVTMTRGFVEYGVVEYEGPSINILWIDKFLHLMRFRGTLFGSTYMAYLILRSVPIWLAICALTGYWFFWPLYAVCGLVIINFLRIPTNGLFDKLDRFWEKRRIIFSTELASTAASSCLFENMTDDQVRKSIAANIRKVVSLNIPGDKYEQVLQGSIEAAYSIVHHKGFPLGPQSGFDLDWGVSCAVASDGSQEYADISPPSRVFLNRAFYDSSARKYYDSCSPIVAKAVRNTMQSANAYAKHAYHRSRSLATGLSPRQTYSNLAQKTRDAYHRGISMASARYRTIVTTAKPSAPASIRESLATFPMPPQGGGARSRNLRRMLYLKRRALRALGLRT